MDLATFTTRELLNLQAVVIGELRNRGILRTKNNPVGDYAEWLVSSALNLKLAKNSAAGHDAESDSGRKFQIKARRVTADNRSRQLGVIRNLEKMDFDELVAVIFDESYEVVVAVSIPHVVIADYSIYRRMLTAIYDRFFRSPTPVPNQTPALHRALGVVAEVALCGVLRRGWFPSRRRRPGRFSPLFNHRRLGIEAWCEENAFLDFTPLRLRAMERANTRLMFYR